MHAVVEYIDRHLDRQARPRGRSLASRIFALPFSSPVSARCVGEALGDYVRRRRLEIAAVRLRAQERATRCCSIALGVGFGSAEAFTRAFRARFRLLADAMAKEQARSGPSQDGKPRSARSKPRTPHIKTMAAPKSRRSAMKVTIDRPQARPCRLSARTPAALWQPGSAASGWRPSHRGWPRINLFGRDRFGIGSR